MFSTLQQNLFLIIKLEKGKHKITLNGVTMTPEEWSRTEGCTVRGSTIIRRISKGMGEEEAIYTPSKTFKGVAN